MHIDAQEVARIADLARIALSDADARDYIADLESILRMVDAIPAVPTEGVAPLAHPLELSQRLRADAVTESDRREAFLALAPAAVDGVYLVPRVVD